MFLDSEAIASIERLVFIYKRMPNGGAALNITPTGFVVNDVCVVAYFTNRSKAIAALKRAGFKRFHYGWKLGTAQ